MFRPFQRLNSAAVSSPQADHFITELCQVSQEGLPLGEALLLPLLMIFIFVFNIPVNGFQKGAPHLPSNPGNQGDTDWPVAWILLLTLLEDRGGVYFSSFQALLS